MGTVIAAVKGTRDFYPEAMAVRAWLYRVIGEVSASFGYQEYDGPFLERLDLYAAKSGEELVKEQAFVFPDRGGELITLRPELTPTLARMVAQRQKQLVYPLRWWSFGPFWRYERPQKGRTREFFQWNADLIGANSPESDAELIALCVAFFRRVGLTPSQVGIFINDRHLMESLLLDLGIVAERHREVFRLIDRREKMNPEAWEDYALSLGLQPVQLDGLKRLLDDKSLWQHSPSLRRVFAALKAYGAVDYVHFDAQIIRGLEYYTGTVFEGRDMGKEGRAILGGGHYDNLVADVGGEPLPGVGFAMGDVMVTLVLEKYGLLPTWNPAPADVLVTVFDAEHLLKSLEISQILREAGLRVIGYTEAIKLDKQLRYAHRAGIRYAVIAGPDELVRDQVALKDLQTGTQTLVALSEVAFTVKAQMGVS
ncbi:histidine--tRNA ligase [uncultured Thermanaerothrix sp.]|uniref:histidine--tRNA ligase n=1 Tax=uncultured Thermanaerothrix sp. TaxID=1195149 RepID=UPI0026280D15|nr:histidine--tRNA ligase [uncultured Thermanaerothrix sp.]